MTNRYPVDIKTGEYANAEYLIVTMRKDVPRITKKHVHVHGAAKTEKGAWSKRRELAGPYIETTGLRVLKRVADGEYEEIGEQE